MGGGYKSKEDGGNYKQPIKMLNGVVVVLHAVWWSGEIELEW